MTDQTIYINGRFLTQALTGVQRYAFELIRAMDAQLESSSDVEPSVRFELLTPADGRVGALSLRHIQLRHIGRLSGQLWEQVELPLHTRRGLLFNPCNTAPLLKRRKVVTIHDAAVFSHPDAYSRAFSTWYRFLFRQICRSATPVITVSEFSRSELIRECNLQPDRSTVIYHGHEHARRTPADAGILDKLGLRGQKFALAVGSLNPTKNFAGLTRALDLLGNPGFTVVVAGGKNRRVFADGQGGWPEFVKLAGYVSDGELRALYQASACFVFPSLYEGFGIPPLEALSCGTQVLAADIPPLREVYGDAVSYCDPTDPAAIARGLNEAMQRPARNEVAVGDCLQRLTWARCASQTIDFLCKAAQ